MRAKIKNSLPVLLLITLVFIVFLFIFIPFVVEDKAFVIGYDIRNQYRPWFTEFRNLIKNAFYQRTFPFWSWNIFYGNNVWASKAYYFMADIYSYISLFFQGHYYSVLIIQTGLKLTVAAITMYLYGQVRGWKKSTSILLALCFAFSAWSLKYVEHPFFLSFYSFVPLYFASIELFFKKKHKYVYSILVAVLLFQNYYFFYTLSIFTVMYYLYRYFEEGYTINNLFKNILDIVLYYIAGVAITSIIIIPSALFILQSSRVFDVGQNLWFYDNIRVYFHLFISLFVPSSTFISKIITKEGIETYTSIYEPLKYQVRELMVWSGSLNALLLPQIFFGNNRKRVNRGVYALLLLLLLIPLGGSIMHGFSEPSFRWTFLLVFANLMMIAPYVDGKIKVDLRILNYTLWFVVSMILLNLPILVLILKYSFVDYLHQYGLFFISVIFILANYFVINFKKMDSVLLIFLVLLESSFVSYITFNDNPSYKKFDWEFINNAEKVLGEKYDELNYYLGTIEPNQGFYRIYAPFDSVYWYMSLNNNLIYNFAEVKTYDSTYQFSNDDILKIMPLDRGLGWSWNIQQEDLIDYSSVKYAIVTHEGELPHEHFDLIGNFRGLDVYRNLNYQSIARTYNNVISYQAYAKNPDPSLINTHVIIDEVDLLEIEESMGGQDMINIENVMVYQNMLLGDFSTNKDSFVVTSIAYDKGWKAYVDDVEVKVYSINGGFIGFKLPEGEHDIKLYFMPEGFKQGFYLSTIGVLLLIALMIKDHIKKGGV